MPKQLKSKPNKARRAAHKEYEHYTIAVETWEYYYSFGAVESSRYQDAGYNRTESISFQGKVLYPEAFKYPRASLTIYAAPELNEENSNRFSLVLGTMDARVDTLHGSVFIPACDMPQLASIAASGRVKILTLNGSPLKWRHGSIRQVSVSTEIEDEHVSERDQPQSV